MYQPNLVTNLVLSAAARTPRVDRLFSPDQEPSHVGVRDIIANRMGLLPDAGG
jgi:hypothetical protein